MSTFLTGHSTKPEWSLHVAGCRIQIQVILVWNLDLATCNPHGLQVKLNRISHPVLGIVFLPRYFFFGFGFTFVFPLAGVFAFVLVAFVAFVGAFFTEEVLLFGFDFWLELLLWLDLVFGLFWRGEEADLPVVFDDGWVRLTFFFGD